SNAFPFDGSGTQQAQGSGFVYDANGDIVTNEHVVDGASSVSVTFWNGAKYKARVVGKDASTDLAVVKVDAPSSLLVPLAPGDSSALAVGDGVVAIGSPLGVAAETSPTGGALVGTVRAGTPAARAGLRHGDVITAVDGQRISSVADLQSAIDAKRPGDRVTIKYKRNGATHTVRVKLATRPT